MLIRITKFKLIEQGNRGIEVIGVERRIKENVEVLADIRLRYKVPLPKELDKTLQRLRKYFIDILGLWESDYDKMFTAGELSDYKEEFNRDSYDRLHALLSKIIITGIAKKDAAYILTANIKTSTSGIMGVATPMIGFKDGYEQYERFSFGCEKCITDVEQYITSRRLIMRHGKQILKDYYAEDEKKLKDIEALTEEEATKVALEHLQNLGAICILPNEMEKQLKDLAEEKDSKPADILKGGIIPETDPVPEGISQKDAD